MACFDNKDYKDIRMNSDDFLKEMKSQTLELMEVNLKIVIYFEVYFYCLFFFFFCASDSDRRALAKSVTRGKSGKSSFSRACLLSRARARLTRVLAESLQQQAIFFKLHHFVGVQASQPIKSQQRRLRGAPLGRRNFILISDWSGDGKANVMSTCSTQSSFPFQVSLTILIYRCSKSASYLPIFPSQIYFLVNEVSANEMCGAAFKVAEASAVSLRGKKMESL